MTLTQAITYTLEVDAALKALAEPRRREILRLVWSEELPATAIAARFEEVTRSAISQHLGVLRAAGLVSERRDGTRRLYRSNHREMAKLRTFLNEYWATGLERLHDGPRLRKQGRKAPMADVTREILVNASPATIFEFLTIPDKHVAWNGTEAELDPRPGGIYRVLVGGNHWSAGEFVEVVPNERVVFTFGWDQPDHPIPSGSTQVEITLIPDGDKTLVRLVHSGLPGDAVADHTAGWDHYLERLALASAGGDPGPDDGPGS